MIVSGNLIISPVWANTWTANKKIGKSILQKKLKGNGSSQKHGEVLNQRLIGGYKSRPKALFILLRMPTTFSLTALLYGFHRESSFFVCCLNAFIHQCLATEITPVLAADIRTNGLHMAALADLSIMGIYKWIRVSTWLSSFRSCVDWSKLF